MDNLVLIEKIELSNDNILYVTPKNYCFTYIYRSAMGVHWDIADKSLYFVSPIKQENDILKAYKQIISALQNEYGKTLKVSSNTEYDNLTENMKNEIIGLSK